MTTMGKVFTVFVVLFGLLPEEVQAGEYCLTSAQQYEYCDYDCCDDDSYYDKCCSETVGAIVGAVIGTIIFIAFIAFIVFCCCYMHKRKASIGTVVHSNTSTIVTTTVPVHPNPYPQPGYYQGPPGYNQGPPGYNQGPPPGYSQVAPGANQATAPYPPQPQPYPPPPNSNPAFPPPPAVY